MDTLQSVKDYLASLPLAAKIAGSVCAGVVTIWILKRSKGKRRVTYPRDTIILHQPFYGPYQLVPFALKLETYLRIVKVPYQLVVSYEPGPKGKRPWIEYNDTVMGDSSFIVKFVNETFNVDLDEGFSKAELGAAHALQKMLEENTYWSMMLYRGVFDKTMKTLQIFHIPFYLYPMMRLHMRNIFNTTYAHGIGRHTKEEILEITVEDLTAVSNFLGNKKFLLGDRPCQADCAVFGQLSEFYWHSFGNECEEAFKEFPNLIEYCDRMVSNYWPDWDDLKAKHDYTGKEYPQNTVILMQIGRGPYAPSLTPFAVKLETYLRMAKIPYENDHSARRSPKGKVPFIIYDGQPIADSAFCIKFLNKTFDIDLNKGFSEEQIGIAHAWRKMLEENTYWTLVLHRWVYDKERQAAKIFGLAWLTTLILTRFVKNMTYRHGIGRHTEDEVYDIMREDLQNLSQFIGTKKFLLGDKPCEDDCAVFGLLSQLYWHMFENRNASIMEDFPNLCSYCERMKETFWPDWNECITSTGK